MLSDEELLLLIEGGESDRVEFTESVGDMDKLRIAICGFANDLPNHKKLGVLFIGLDDHGNCAKLLIDDPLMQKLGGLTRDGKTHPFPNAAVAKKNLRGCEIAVIQVEPSENPPVKVDGRCWIRSGPRRALATAEEERRLVDKRRWGNLPYDMRGVTGTTVENDLDMQKFESEYLPSVIPAEILRENRRAPKDQLKALRLVDQSGTPTVAGILMLGADPQRWFPGAYIQFVRYEGNCITDPVIDQSRCFGRLSDQLHEIDNRMKGHIFTALDTKGERHTENPAYPFVALREIVRNAVIHRNYDDTNSPVRVTWLSDRIEIISPGSVYGPVTSRNFGNPGVTGYRNPTIAEAMYRMGFMQQFGMGIPTARRALEENGNPEPDFDIQDTLVFATIRRRL